MLSGVQISFNNYAGFLMQLLLSMVLTSQYNVLRIDKSYIMIRIKNILLMYKWYAILQETLLIYSVGTRAACTILVFFEGPAFIVDI